MPRRSTQYPRPTHVVHLAAITAASVVQRDIRKTWNVGTLNVVLAAADAAPNSRLIFCGSAEVYGTVPAFTTGSLSTKKPYSTQLVSMARVRPRQTLLVGQMALQGLKAVPLRPFNDTGPGQSEQFAFAAQMARIEKWQAPARKGRLSKNIVLPRYEL